MVALGWGVVSYERGYPCNSKRWAGLRVGVQTRRSSLSPRTGRRRLGLSQTRRAGAHLAPRRCVHSLMLREFLFILLLPLCLVHTSSSLRNPAERCSPQAPSAARFTQPKGRARYVRAGEGEDEGAWVAQVRPSLSHALSLTHTPSHTLSLSHTHTHSLSHTLSHTRSSGGGRCEGGGGWGACGGDCGEGGGWAAAPAERRGGCEEGGGLEPEPGSRALPARPCESLFILLLLPRLELSDTQVYEP